MEVGCLPGALFPPAASSPSSLPAPHCYRSGEEKLQAVSWEEGEQQHAELILPAGVHTTDVPELGTSGERSLCVCLSCFSPLPAQDDNDIICVHRLGG